MSPDLHEEIALELDKLRQLFSSFSELLEKTKVQSPDTVETVALAGFLHSLYNGIENILKRIALSRGEGLPRYEFWHMRFLKQMAQPTQERTPVINSELFAHLKTVYDLPPRFSPCLFI